MRRILRLISLIRWRSIPWGVAPWILVIAVLLLEKRALAAAAAAVLTASIFAPGIDRLNRLLLVSLSISLLAHSVALFTILDRQLIAVTLATAAIILFWRSRTRIAKSQIRSLRLALTWVLTIVAIIHLFVRGSGSFGAGANTAEAKASPKPGFDAAGQFTGVILIPELRKQPALLLRAWDKNLEHVRPPDKDPITIPFDGVYWFFRFPNSKPPADSVTLHGSPDEIRFRSSGYVTLRMEARQALNPKMSAAHISSIQLGIKNVETETSRLTAELILSDASLPGEPRQSLGMQNITRAEDQTIAFAMPAYPLLAEFNSLTVRILRTGLMTTQSARVSIENFVLLPR